MRITRWGEYGILCCLYLARKERAVAGPGKGVRSTSAGEAFTGGATVSQEQASSDTVGAAEIAAAQGIPLQYAQQILHRLKKGKVVRSLRGPHGGYALQKSPGNTSLKEILYAAEGDTFEVLCDTDPVYESCAEGRPNCGLRQVWRELKFAIDALLDQRSLAQVLEWEIRAEQEALIPGPKGTVAPSRKGSHDDARKIR